MRRHDPAATRLVVALTLLDALDGRQRRVVLVGHLTQPLGQVATAGCQPALERSAIGQEQGLVDRGEELVLRLPASGTVESDDGADVALELVVGRLLDLQLPSSQLRRVLLLFRLLKRIINLSLPLATLKRMLRISLLLLLKQIAPFLFFLFLRLLHCRLFMRILHLHIP